LLNIGPMPDGRIPLQQENILRELALWMLVNKEAVINTRPYTPIRQGDIYFTQSKDGKTLYAAVTGTAWKHGERKDFRIEGIKGGDETRVTVLGHNGRVVEYRRGLDASPHWENVEKGLRISAVRGQRLYNNFSWPNPVILKITDYRQ